ncbi:phospholipase D-like protein [Cytobacillus oceanisediminis]|uniref:phospholipase D n=1 Tax=Cytobacillus oceanisediminis TaxID=665099 RepID=A0A2V2ZZA2_9BACI|nr:phospholipase D-like domain-containing protein [Cytobacillus oceanisediminis]PWW27800.1 phospholipase D-like protein [Cytobacillus oceanisediminis]
MNEEQFLRTMVETVKYGKNPNKNELLTLLRNSEIDFDKTGVFASKYRHFEEYIDLRVPVPMLEQAEFLRDDLEKLTALVYRSPGNYEYAGLNIKPKPVELENIPPQAEHDVVFDEIKDKIIQGIRRAEYTIWVAVAWFTDIDIYRELILRKIDGLNIRIITSDEPTNQTLLADFERNFEVVKVPKKRYNRLHNKFCIIDLEYVMHGSYNWSNTAPNNNETWATALDRDFVKKFADEFMELFVNNYERY